MKYCLNDACDTILWGKKAEFLFFHSMIQVESEDLSETLVKALPLLVEKKGCTLATLQRELPAYDPDDISLMIQELAKQKVVIPVSSRKEKQDFFNLLDTAKKKDLLLWSSLPQLSFQDESSLIRGVGFRLGQQYILGFWQRARKSVDAIQQVYAWAAGREWLKRGRLLFEPTINERIIMAQDFVPPKYLPWLRTHLNHLIENRRNQEGIYVVDLNKATTHYSPLIEQKSQLCFTGPFEPILEASQQNAYVEEPFSRTCTAAMARYHTPVANWNEDTWAWGNNPNPSLAMDIAYAEAIERYCAGNYPNSAMKKGILQKKPSVRINPYSLLDLTPDQLDRAGLKVFTTESEALWIPAVELFSGRPVEILADLCLYPFHRPRGYSPYFWASSSGMAAHRTKNEATLRALFELIERDAFMVTWLRKKRPPHISQEILSEDVLQQFKNELYLKGFSLELLDLTLRGVPTVMAVLHRDEWPAFCCGCSTRLTFREAAIAAFREAESALFGALQVENEERHIMPQDVVLPEDHGRLYYNPQHLANVRFLWESNKKSPLKAMRKKRWNLLELASFAGISTLYRVEYFSPDPLLSVVRLDTPDLVSVTFGYGLEPQMVGVRKERSTMFPHPLA